VAQHLNENTANPEFTRESHQCQIASLTPLTLAAQHLSENTKNPDFTRARHFAGIPKSGNPKLHHLHWRHNVLVKIPKIRISQGQVTLPEFPNQAIPNCPTSTGGTIS